MVDLPFRKPAWLQLIGGYRHTPGSTLALSVRNNVCDRSETESLPLAFHRGKLKLSNLRGYLERDICCWQMSHIWPYLPPWTIYENIHDSVLLSRARLIFWKISVIPPIKPVGAPNSGCRQKNETTLCFYFKVSGKATFHFPGHVAIFAALSHKTDTKLEK